MRPRPSSVTVAESCVSLLLRVTLATFFLLKPNLHRVCVCAESFEMREADGRVAQGLEILSTEAEDAGPFQERVYAQRRSEARGTGCGERVIGSGRVVA